MTGLKNSVSVHVLPRLIISLLLFPAVPAALPVQAFCSAASMQAPRFSPQHPSHYQEPETSVVRLVFLGAIDFYRSTISPTSGARCGFSPSCSAFGRQAVKEYSPLQGVMMTADRLTRCNIFKEPDRDYFPLPDGLLFDPVFYNALGEQ